MDAHRPPPDARPWHPAQGHSRRDVIRMIGGAAFAVPIASALAGCGGQDTASTLRVSYQQFGSGQVMRNYITEVARQFSQQRPELAVDLVPLVAAENDYFTKNELMMSSARTATDLVYEDTFILNSDVAAGYLRPIDDYLADWPQWRYFQPVTRDAVKAEDGKRYGVPTSTDTRAIWYHSELFRRAGLPVPWQPRTWADVLTAARTIKRRLPGVIPLNLYASKASGEKTSMQGFEMLLYGTDSTLYDQDARKWVLGSKGFLDSLGFVRTLFAEKLGPPLNSALDPNLSEQINNAWFPQGKIAMAVDGSWISSAWREGASGEWPQAAQVMRMARMPTQRGQAPGMVTLSGGWLWALPAKASRPDLAWELLKVLASTENMTDFTVADGNVTVRTDVAAQPAYRNGSPFIPFFTDLVKNTTYRPALAPYPQVSNAIQIASESVMLGGSPAAAAKAYDSTVTGIVGPDQTMREA